MRRETVWKIYIFCVVGQMDEKRREVGRKWCMFRDYSMVLLAM
jgi:hypothetical protein